MGKKYCIEIANVFYDKFSSVTGTNVAYDVYPEFRPNKSFINRLSTRYIKECIDKLSTGVGFDAIHLNHLKFSSEIMILYFTKLINSCLIHNHVPVAMLKGVINPIINNKSGNHRDLNIIEKLWFPQIFSNFLNIAYCLLLKVYLCAHLSSAIGVVPPLYWPTLCWKKLLSVTCVLVALSTLDLSKAFERVNHVHEFLLRKLERYGCPSHTVNILPNYIYRHTRVRVHVGCTFSDEWSTGRCVRQGGVTSTYLFNIYIVDILSNNSSMNIGSVASLQLLFDKISELIDNHELLINMNRTVAMTFSKRSGRGSREIKLFLNDNVLHVVLLVHDFNYLGCVLTSRLYDGLDIDRCNLSFKRSFGFFFRKFHNVHIDVVYSLFNSFRSSFYASELWVARNKCSRSFKDFSIGYHFALKKILGFPKFYSNHFTCNILNALTFENFINAKCIKFFIWLSRNNCSSIKPFIHYFLTNSHLKRNIGRICIVKYNISNVLSNDLDAINARIKYVQDREPNSILNAKFYAIIVLSTNVLYFYWCDILFMWPIICQLVWCSKDYYY